MSNSVRAAFVTIGQTPRRDIVPEMMAEILAGLSSQTVTAAEFGVLDNLDDDELLAMRAGPFEASFATVLRNGDELVTSKERTEVRLNDILQKLDQQGFDFIVLLCTGTKIEPLKNTLVIESQRLVDKTVEAIAVSSKRLGVIVPLERQVAEFADRHVFAGQPVIVSASPYGEHDFHNAAQALQKCDLIIMHCMGYDAAMLAQVKDLVSAPVLLSRRIVSSAVRQLI